MKKNFLSILLIPLMASFIALPGNATPTPRQGLYSTTGGAISAVQLSSAPVYLTWRATSWIAEGSLGIFDWIDREEDKARDYFPEDMHTLASTTLGISATGTVALVAAVAVPASVIAVISYGALSIVCSTYDMSDCEKTVGLSREVAKEQNGGEVVQRNQDFLAGQQAKGTLKSDYDLSKPLTEEEANAVAADVVGVGNTLEELEAQPVPEGAEVAFKEAVKAQ